MARKKLAKKPAPKRAAKPAAKAKKSAGKAQKPAARSAATSRAASARRSATRPRPAATKPAAHPKWRPEGMHDLVVNLVYKDATAALDFYQAAFGAQKLMCMMSPDGRSVWHAEMRIGNAVFFLNDESPMGSAVAAGPEHRATASLQIYTPDCDALFNRAVQAGAKPVMPLSDMFWGDRMGSVMDPFGQSWMLATRVKELSPEQMRKAGEEFARTFAQQMQEQQHAGGNGSAPPSAS